MKFDLLSGALQVKCSEEINADAFLMYTGFLNERNEILQKKQREPSAGLKRDSTLHRMAMA